MKIFPIWLLLLLSWSITLGQAVQSDFVLPSQACLQEKILISNLADLDLRYEWDFCQGDLALTPSSSIVTTLPGNITTGIDIVFDGENWFGFVTSRDDNSVIRLEFGPDLQSAPVATDLGNINNVFNKPGDIKIVYDQGKWYGFVYGVNDPVISRIDFGSDLANTTESVSPATATTVVSGDGLSNGGFDMMYDGTNWIIAFIQNPFVNLVRLTSVTAVPGTNDKITGITNTIGSGLTDITIQKHADNYYGYVVAQNETLQKYSFGTEMFSIPVVENLTSAIPTGSRPFGITSGLDNGLYYLFISTLEGNLYKIDLGTDLSQSPVSGTDLGKLAFLSNTLKLKLIKYNSSYSLFSSDFTSQQLFRVNFPNPQVCPAEFLASNEREPIISFLEAGTTHVSLRSFKGGNFSEVDKTIVITSQVAPMIYFSTENVCVDHPVDFFSVVDETVVQSSWDFGDGQALSGSLPETNHTYTSPGIFNVKLQAQSANGCSNLMLREVTIYNQPQASFESLTGLICTNNAFVFMNKTVGDYNGLLTYQWFVNNVLVGEESNLNHIFYGVGNYEFKLKAIIPGCSNEVIEIIENVQTGPVVDFSIRGNCESENIEFTNLSSGNITSYQWLFGNNEEAAEKDPVAEYTPGNYVVTLKTTGANGCISHLSKDLKIDPKPAVDFAIFPELLCTNAGVEFNDLTPTPSGSALQKWNWSFGDEGSSESGAETEHIYENMGEFIVSLTITTNFGCSDSIAKQITINKSPSAEFTNSTACEGLPVSLSAIDPDSKSWIWKIGDKTYQTKSPVHTFRDPGDFEVNVKVTGVNGCETSETRSIQVPAPLIPDFSWTKNCVGQQVTFADLTTGLDPVIDWRWNMNEETELNGNPGSWSWDQPGDKIIGLTVKAISGCTYSVTKTISIVPMPKASFTPMPQIGTPPARIRFNNLSTNATMYNWDFNDGTYSDETAPEHIFLNEGDFNVILKAFNAQGCEHNISRQVVISPPSPDVNIKAITTSDNADGSIKVVITLENEGNTSLTNLPVYIDISGNLSLREVIEGPILPMSRYNLTLSYGLRRSKELTFLCAETELANDRNQEQNKSCVQFENDLLFLSGYPNPVRDYLTVEWIAKQDEEISISILNATGHSIREFRVMSEPGFNQEVIDVSEFQKGIYLLVLKGHSTKSTQHIIISN